MDVLTFAWGQGFAVCGLIRSPLLGPKGNVEFLAWLGVGDDAQTDILQLVQRVLGE
jgi:predicted rRNA methylase YqxC with S4 and FtsJ domains